MEEHLTLMIRLGIEVIPTPSLDSAADTFTVETAGNERVRVTSTGIVGIGTDNPNHKLHLYDGSAGCDLTITSGNANAVDINLGDVDDHDKGRIRYNNTNNSMSFRTNGDESVHIKK